MGDGRFRTDGLVRPATAEGILLFGQSWLKAVFGRRALESSPAVRFFRLALRTDALQQDGGRFVVGILRDEFATNANFPKALPALPPMFRPQ